MCRGHLQPTYATTVLTICRSVSTYPRCEGSKQLEGKGHLRRIHAGRDYVIIYSILDDVVVVLVVRSQSA